MTKAWEVWLLLMRSDPKRVVHIEEKEKKEKKGHSASMCDREKHTWEKSWSKSAIRPLWEKHKWELQEVQSEKIEKNTVRVWESEKEKWDIFLCSSCTQRK